MRRSHCPNLWKGTVIVTLHGCGRGDDRGLPFSQSAQVSHTLERMTTFVRVYPPNRELAAPSKMGYSLSRSPSEPSPSSESAGDCTVLRLGADKRHRRPPFVHYQRQYVIRSRMASPACRRKNRCFFCILFN